MSLEPSDTIPPNSFNWPRFKTYDEAYLRRISMPVGGIGTGTIGIGGRGDWNRFEIINRPALDFKPSPAFFALRTEVQGKAGSKVFCRALEGPIATEDYEGGDGCRVADSGLPRFERARFHATYPLAEVSLEDEDCPVQVTLQSFSPFVVGDVRESSWPVAAARFVLENRGTQSVRASICGSFRNFLGSDGAQTGVQDNENIWVERGNFCAIAARAPHLDPQSPFFGSFALGLLGQATSFRTSWAKLSWGDSMLDFWDDFSADGHLENRDTEDQTTPIGSLCAETTLEAGETRALTFLWAWHFPNRMSWTPEGKAVGVEGAKGGWCNAQGGDIVGNAYAERFTDATDVLSQVVPRLPELEAQTVEFARTFYGSDMPDEIKEAAGFNLSTLRSPTLFQTRDGHFFGWEGVGDHHGSCFGNCTHVWNYEQATAFLFPEIARDFRRTEFLHMADESGLMCFRVGQPLEKYARPEGQIAATDGQCGTLLKLLRDWKLSGDDNFLRELWPQARRCMEFCWIPGGWDADGDGVMEGCQHNTMDVEYFGPNPQMQFLYLAALGAAAEMADHMGESDFAEKCRVLAEKGKRWTVAHLWNGEYFEHQIRPPASEVSIAAGIRSHMGAADLTNPELQLGAGCLVDQVVGVWLGEICGVTNVLEPELARQTLNSVLHYNRRDRGSFNHTRSYALGDEEALLMASYPRGHRPARPFPYFNEAMTGFEHCVASHLLFLGENDKALKVIRDVRKRYNGRNRNPFDEAECGRHYARAMASYGHILGYTGFEFDARSGTMKLNPSSTPVTYFWSIGTAWGTVSQIPQSAPATSVEVTLHVCGGTLDLRGFELKGFGVHVLEMEQTVGQNEIKRFFV